jgi:hypothetical protein
VCDCEDRVHPGINCSSEGCKCHPVDEEEELIYMSISFPSVPRATAADILKAALSVAGQVSYNVYYNDDPDDEDDTDG